MTMAKPVIVFVLGSPASGKGTLSGRLATEHSHIYHLSMGDFLRTLIKPGGPLANQPNVVESIRSGGTRGGLVRMEVIMPHLMEKFKEEMGSGKKVFLMDGFPRSLEQNTGFKEAMRREFDIDTPDLTIWISCEKTVAKQRYSGRGRQDDSEELFEKRYLDYEKRDMQVVDLHREMVVEVKIDGTLKKDDEYRLFLEKLASSPIVKEKSIL